MIRVVITEDHAIVRHGLRLLLETEGGFEVIGEAEHGGDLMGLLHILRPDVLLLDVAMPGIGGYETLQRLAGEYPGLPVLVLSMYPEEQYALRLIKAGAAGYLTKEAAPTQLVHAVRQVAAGRKFISPGVAELLAEQICGQGEEAPHQRLSAREYQVLCHIASGRTTSQIAECMALSVPTISTYRSRILAKMRMHTNAELIYYAVRMGLVGQLDNL